MIARKISHALFSGCLMFFLAAIATHAGAQQLTVETDSPLLAEPRADASVVTRLKKGTSAEQVGKQGMFVNVKTAGGTGWVYAFNVRLPAGQPSASGGGGGRGPSLSGKVAVTSTIGIRGLSAEDLRKTHTDQQQLELLDSYVASAQDAEAAAASSGLAAARVEYF